MREEERPLLGDQDDPTKVEVRVVNKNINRGGYGAVSQSTSDEASSSQGEEPKDETKINYTGIYRFATWKDYFLIFLGTIAATAHGASNPLMFIIFGDMTNSFVDFGKYSACDFNWTLCKQMNITNETEAQFNEDIIKIMDLNGTITKYALYFVYLACFIIVAAGLQITCWMTQAVRQIKVIRLEFFKSILRQDIGYFDTNSTGEMTTRLADDVRKIQDGISDKVSISIQMIMRAVTGVAIGFIYSWKLSLVILAVSPLLMLSATILFKLSTLFTKRELAAYAKAGSIAEEVMSSIRTVVAFGGEEKESLRYEKNLIPAKKLGIWKGFINGLGQGFLQIVMFSTYGLAFWYGSRLIFDGELEVGNMLTAFFGILVGAFSIGGATANVEYFSSAAAAAGKIFELIDRVPPIDSLSDTGHKPHNVHGSITFKKVNFTYPSRPDVQVLKNVSFTAETGKTIALCGQSGCGKSTCVQLIQRFYDPQQGEIEFDGHDIRSLNVRWLRENIGVVSQEPILFDTTILENIKFGREGVSDRDCYQAAKQANAYDFIMQLPNKFDTLVGEGGTQMSGGQKQRIAIARAIVRNPKIMLLDEATSALDTESEAIVQAALEKAAQGRTTIVIAHRLSTIRNADIIIGFHEGRVMEQGSHNELLKVENGVYQNLVHMQTYAADNHDAVIKPTIKRSTSRKRRITSTSSAGGVETHSGTSNEVEDDKQTEKDEEDLPPVSLGRAFAYNKPEIPYIIFGCFAAAINGGVQPLFSVLFANVLSVFADSDQVKQKHDIMLYALLFVGMGVVGFFAHILQGTMFAKSGEELTNRLRSMGFRQMIRQDIAFFDDHKNSTGALTTRLATDASRVQSITGIRLGVSVQSVFAMGVGLGLAFYYGWQLTLLTLAFVPFMIAAGAIMMKLLTGKSNVETKAMEEVGKLATEVTLNIRTVASLTKENYFYKQYKEAMQTPYKQSLTKAFVYGISFGFSQSIVFFAYAGTFRFGAYLVFEGLMTFDNVYKVLMAVIFGAITVGQVSSMAPDYAQAKISAARLFKLLDRTPEIDSTDASGERPNYCTGKTTFTGCKFTYPTRPDVLVLKGLSVGVEPGQTLALVGQSGCGKSTCIQLLERFYDPSDGVVVLHDNDTRTLNIAWLRSQMGIVSQEPVLFDRSIADNIRYGDNSRDNISLDEVIAAAKSANIHSFIDGLPEKYNTNVGGKGTQLSGGQKQRVAIARALIRNPKILLLDEATSALDAESEKIVQAALDAARKGRTCIVIAHRLSTVKNADNIAVIENGTVVEFGKHDELIAMKGSYYSLVNAQLTGSSEIPEAAE